MTVQTPHARCPNSDIIDIDYHRAEALMLRNQHTCNLMRGATVTTWTLVAGAVLVFAVIAFAPRNSVTPGVASSSAPITIALKAR